MDMPSWHEFLRRWWREIIAWDPEACQEMPEELVATGWLGHAGATEARLVVAEARLGIRLPPSYRAFLSVTDGCWLVSGYGFPYHFWSTGEVEWFAVRNQAWIDAWIGGYRTLLPTPILVPDEEYLAYGPEQGGAFREEYLPSMLEVSNSGGNGAHDSIYLLNPRIVTEDGEWEAWYFDHEEITRYRSFWVMLQAAHEEFLQVRELERRG